MIVIVNQLKTRPEYTWPGVYGKCVIQPKQFVLMMSEYGNDIVFLTGKMTTNPTGPKAQPRSPR